ncbi:MAG: STAS domain-containing protein [Planctomycetales bacterium]|nr:STAS domain-containing protein [Planctomycetales bacterium]
MIPLLVAMPDPVLLGVVGGALALAVLVGLLLAKGIRKAVEEKTDDLARRMQTLQMGSGVKPKTGDDGEGKAVAALQAEVKKLRESVDLLRDKTELRLQAISKAVESGVRAAPGTAAHSGPPAKAPAEDPAAKAALEAEKKELAAERERLAKEKQALKDELATTKKERDLLAKGRAGLDQEREQVARDRDQIAKERAAKPPPAAAAAAAPATPTAGAARPGPGPTTTSLRAAKPPEAAPTLRAPGAGGLDVEKREGILRVKVSYREVKKPEAQEMVDAIFSQTRTKEDRVLLDLSNTSYVNSSGLSAITKIALERDCRIVLTTDDVIKVMDLMGFLPLLQICATEAEALRAFAGAA